MSSALESIDKLIAIAEAEHDEAIATIEQAAIERQRLLSVLKQLTISIEQALVEPLTAEDNEAVVKTGFELLLYATRRLDAVFTVLDQRNPFTDDEIQEALEWIRRFQITFRLLTERVANHLFVRLNLSQIN